MLALAGITALAGFVFLWQLGSSSFFMDEVLSMRSSETLGGLFPALRRTENSPAGYFALLHVWRELTGASSEWAVRLPSALAAVALVPAVWWLARIADSPRTAWVAATLAALSPLVLQYAQLARPYAFGMLLVAVAVAAALLAARAGSRRWLAVAAVASAVILALNYAALAVIAPLAVWLLSRPTLEFRARLFFCATVAVAWAVWVPLAVLQQRHHPGSDLAPYGTLNLEHIASVVSAPVDERYNQGLHVVQAVAAVAVVIAAAAFARHVVRTRDGAGLLLLSMIVAPLLGVVAMGAVELDVVHTRYMTFAIPALLVVTAGGITRLSPIVALPVALVLVGAAVMGTVGSHRQSGFYPDTRAAAEAIASDWKPGDEVISSEWTVGVGLDYYLDRSVEDDVQVHVAGAPGVDRLFAMERRIWLVEVEGAEPDPPWRGDSVKRLPAAVDLHLSLAARQPVSSAATSQASRKAGASRWR